MTDTAPRTADRSEIEVIAELDEWLNENWDPEITVAEWWERLGLSGWGAPMWPEEWYGKDLNRHEYVAVQNRISEFGALPAPAGSACSWPVRRSSTTAPTSRSAPW